MAIRQYLHVELCEKLRNEFIKYATTTEVESNVLENTLMYEERKKLNDKIQRLQKAKEELHKI